MLCLDFNSYILSNFFFFLLPISSVRFVYYYYYYLFSKKCSVVKNVYFCWHVFVKYFYILLLLHFGYYLLDYLF